MIVGRDSFISGAFEEPLDRSIRRRVLHALLRLLAPDRPDRTSWSIFCASNLSHRIRFNSCRKGQHESKAPVHSVCSLSCASCWVKASIVSHPNDLKGSHPGLPPISRKLTTWTSTRLRSSCFMSSLQFTASEPKLQMLLAGCVYPNPDLVGGLHLVEDVLQGLRFSHKLSAPKSALNLNILDESLAQNTKNPLTFKR